MSRRRDHRVRMDASHCPDPDGCRRLYHGTLGGPLPGDTCECCGQEVTDPEEIPGVTRAHLTPEQRLASCAVDLVVGVSRRRLRRARGGNTDSGRAGVSWQALVELADELDAQYPGWLDAAYDVVEQTRG